MKKARDFLKHVTVVFPLPTDRHHSLTLHDDGIRLVLTIQQENK